MGLIGGLGVAAEIYYYQRLVKALEAREERPRLLLAHADLNTVFAHLQAGEMQELAQYLVDFVVTLRKAGSDVVAMSAVTPHVCIARLSAASPIPIVSVIDIIRNEIEERSLGRIALFGTRYVMETDLFGALAGSVDVVQPKPAQVTQIDSV